MNRRKFFSPAIRVALAWLLLAVSVLAESWYKGNLHTHSFWSDGREFPEMVAVWYRDRGYHFMAFTDHHVTQTGEKWANITTAEKAYGVIAACQKRFGPDSVITRQEGEKILAKLKTFPEVQKLVEEPGRFLLLQGEEITARYLNVPVHVNAINLYTPVAALKEKDTTTTLIANVKAALEALKQEKNQGIVVINHPNFHYALTAEDLAETDACFFEVYNAHPGSNNEGDSKHPDTEKMWDIASSLRLLKWKKPPLFGLATDDSHHYHEFAPNRANPGRAFVMVRARELTVPEIIAALQRGDFYASSGVILQEVRYEARERKLVVQVQPEKDTHYRIDFIGTTIDAEARPETVLAPESVPEEQSLQKAPGRFTGRYRPQIGHVFLSVKGTSATYTLTGKELYVRAVVTSDRPVPWLPPEEGIYQKAWTQPVGWPQANH